MPDKDSVRKTEDDEPDLLDRSTAELDDYAESSTQEHTTVIGKTAHAEDADPAEVPERDDSEIPD